MMLWMQQCCQKIRRTLQMPTYTRTTCSSDDGRRVAACERHQVGDGERDGRQRLHHLELVLAEVAAGPLVLLQVEAHSGPSHACARKPEDDARAILEDDADALVLGHAAVHRVLVLEHVVPLDLHALVL